MRRVFSKNYGWGDRLLLLLATVLVIILFGLALTACFGPIVAWMSFFAVVAVVFIAVTVRDHRLGQYLPRSFAIILAIGGSVGALTIWPQLLDVIGTPFDPKLRADFWIWCQDLWLVLGYVVYFGWLWRAAFGFPRFKAVLLWITSLLVHMSAPIFIIFLPPSDQGDWFLVFWFAFVTVLSLIALRWELARKELPDA